MMPMLNRPQMRAIINNVKLIKTEKLRKVVPLLKDLVDANLANSDEVEMFNVCSAELKLRDTGK